MSGDSSEIGSGLDRIRVVIDRFVSRMRWERPWYDVHMPLTPAPIRSERPALPDQRLLAHRGRGQ